MFVLVLGRSRSRFAGSDLERGRAHSFRWLWRWRYTCSHSEHSSQAHLRRWYLGGPPWERRSPPGFLERPPPLGGGLSHSDPELVLPNREALLRTHSHPLGVGR